MHLPENGEGEGYRMIVMVCIDDTGGMLFHNRRQSQDRLLRQRVLAQTGGRPLWTNAYSAGQFSPEDALRLRVAENFLDLAQPGEYCFVETVPLRPYAKRIETLYLYRWNRRYPADQRLDLDLSGWTLARTADFPGHSHKIITEEVYRP